MLKNLVDTFLKFNGSAFSVFRNVEKVYYKFSSNHPGYLREYSTLSRKYYHVLNLFFWWACGTGMNNCSRIVTSKVFDKFSNKLRKLNLAPSNYFSTYCVYAKASYYWKDVNILVKKRKGYVEFLIDHIQTYPVTNSIKNSVFNFDLEPQTQNRAHISIDQGNALEFDQSQIRGD